MFYTSLLDRLEEVEWLSSKVTSLSGSSSFSRTSRQYRFHRRRIATSNASIRTSTSCSSVNAECEGGGEGSDVGGSIDRLSLVRLLLRCDLRFGAMIVLTACITLLERDQTVRVRFRQRGERSSQRVQRVEGRS